METEQMVACPRCGSDPELVRLYENCEITVAQCSNEKCGYPIATGLDKAMARKLWNIRAGGRKPAVPETDGVKALASATCSASGWALETMMMINDLTPDIKGKAFDVEWFLLRERLEQAGRVIDAGKTPNATR